MLKVPLQLSIRQRVLLLSMAFMLLITALLLWFLSENLRFTREEANAKLQLQAKHSARYLEQHFNQIESNLKSLAQRPMVRALDPTSCDPMVIEFIRLNPEFSTLAARDRNAVPICSFLANPPEANYVLNTPFFQQILQTERYVAGDAIPGRRTGRWVSVQEQPIFNLAGNMIGTLGLAIDLNEFSQQVFRHDVNKVVITVLDRQRHVLMRSQDPQQYIGQSAAAWLANAPLAQEQGIFLHRRADGISRVHAFVKLPKFDWIILAEQPETEVFAAYSALQQRSLLIGLAIFVVLLLFAWQLSNAIIRPISALARTAAEVAGGKNQLRAALHGPSEIVTVAKQLNRMLDVFDQNEENLLANRAQLAGMIDAAMDAIITTDEEFNIILFNRAAEQMFGYPAYQILGSAIEALIPAKHAIHHRQLMHQFSAQGDGTRKMRSESQRQVMGLRMDGSEFPVEVSISFSSNYGRPIYTAMVRDITERKAHETELQALTASLEQKVEERTHELASAKQLAESATQAKSAFLANMSHEIRTPLNSVLGMTHLAQQTQLTVKQREYLQNITLSGTHLLGIINDILDFSKIEAGMLELDIEDFNLLDILSDLKSLMQQKVEEKGISLHLLLDEQVQPYRRGDALRINQVLLNLITNAMKFTERGGITVSVSAMNTGGNDDGICFLVQDTGIGISRDTQAKLFQSFQQADNSTTRKYGGTGLGLVICQQLVELMGGVLHLSSEEGIGSEFSFCLQLPAASPRMSVSKHEIQQRLSSPDLLLGMRILLVDDHPFNRQIGSELLEQVGAEVVMATNGFEAIYWAQQMHFDAILMDVQMPEMDGLTATEVLRCDPSMKDTPIIAMTANVSNQDRQRCFAVGMNDFISKPVKPEKLYQTLFDCLHLTPNHAVTADPMAVAPIEVEASMPNEVLIDLSVMREMLGDDLERQRRYFTKFATAMQDGLLLIHAQALTDVVQLGKESHRLKSIARTVGALPLGEQLAALEKVDPNIDGEILQVQIVALDNLFVRTRAYLQQLQFLD